VETKVGAEQLEGCTDGKNFGGRARDEEFLGIPGVQNLGLIERIDLDAEARVPVFRAGHDGLESFLEVVM
jgi:hypothetical protein